MAYQHVPVLLREVIDYLNPQSGGRLVDCTLGGAGYTIEIAKIVGRKGQVFSFDLDEMAIKNAEIILRENKIKNVRLINDNFRYFKEYINEDSNQPSQKQVDGIVFDLGLSSAQLEDRGRGFSFLLDAPVEMGFAHQKTVNSKQTPLRQGSAGQATENIVNKYKQSDLEKIIREYGEERYAKSIAKAIINYRRKKKIERTGELVEIIGKAVPGSYKNNKKIHFATRTFQALRIETNDELGSLKDALQDCLETVKPGGRIVVVSFHSLEDRIVKQLFKQESKDCVCPPEIPVCRCDHQAKIKILTKKIITASEEEQKGNPRSRSAKLRAAEII